MDYMMGCFIDRFGSEWGETEIVWFAALLDEEDPDVMAWAMGTEPVPERFTGALMDRFRKLDFVVIER